MKGNSLNGNNYTYNLIKKGLDATSLRGKAIDNNLSNINTKGYKRQYVTFEETLSSSMNGLEMKKTDEKHLGNGEEAGSIKLKTDKSDSMRQDGNNVDLDNETVNLAANTLMYNALITRVNGKISSTRYVINGR